MHNITGPPVEGEDFFGRQNELAYCWDSIVSGNNIALPSPRRVGKTSFALKLLATAKDAGWNTVSINLEKVSTEADFIQLLVEQLQNLSWWERTKEKGSSLMNFLKQLRPSAEYQGVKLQLNWEENKEDVYKQVADLLDHNERTLIFLDEVTVLLNCIMESGSDGKQKVTRFLHWLRDIRITSGSKIRWIVCSSVGIENFLHKHRISDTMNEVTDYKLKSFKHEESIAMLRMLGDDNGVKLDDAIMNRVIEKLEYCLPFFLQITFEKIKYLVKVEDLPLNVSIVDIAYEALIQGKHFNTWVERIHEQYGNNKVHAVTLLNHMSREKKGSKRDTLTNLIVSEQTPIESAEAIVSLLLYMLSNDGYIIEEDGLYRFRSSLLRDFWFNRHLK
jgi:uncharacterized protein